jgi:3-oxoacyl-[acyl-carrier protein] reductase
MTKVWAKELGSFGIRCVAIAPGFIDTKSTHKALTEEKIKSIKFHTPIKALGDVKDIAEATKFLIENDFVNGNTLHINGGIVI